MSNQILTGEECHALYEKGLLRISERKMIYNIKRGSIVVNITLCENDSVNGSCDGSSKFMHNGIEYNGSMEWSIHSVYEAAVYDSLRNTLYGKETRCTVLDDYCIYEGWTIVPTEHQEKERSHTQ
jgi:hypothetical protein